MSYHYRFDHASLSLMTVERETRQRIAIRSVLRGAKRPLSPPEVLAQARRFVRAVGLATVYRNLKRMVEDGTVHVIHLPGESPRYEPAALAHHHHFQCTRCTRIFDVPGCEGTLRHRVPSGFTVEHHDVTLYGRCAECRVPQRRARR
jgi:Fur family ferric uptake transcriptional regulator